MEGAGLEAANEAADDLGGVGGGLLPENAAREEAGDVGIEDGAVEGVGIVDRQEEGVDPAQGGDVGLCHGDNRGGGVRGEGRERQGGERWGNALRKRRWLW